MLDTGRSQQLLEIGGVVVGPRCKSKCLFIQLFTTFFIGPHRTKFGTFSWLLWGIVNLIWIE